MPTLIAPSATRIWTRLLSFAISLALILLAVAPLAVMADETWADGDAATPAVSNPLDFGDEVCLNTTPSKSVTLAISRQANANAANVFANSATLTWTRSFDGTALSATVPSSSALPSDWTSQSFGTLGGVTSSIVTLDAALTAVEGDFSEFVSYTATGAKNTNPSTTISRSTDIAVSGTVISCDDDPPVLSLPADMTVEATNASGATVLFTATASDASPTNPAVICSPASGSTFALGTTTVNCSATDDAGNTGNGSFDVTVVDTTAPLLSGTPADIGLEATNGTGEVVTYTNPTASDAVSPAAPTVSCSPPSGSTFTLGATIVTCSATDDAGNTGQSQFTVTVSDTTAPTLVLPGNLVEEATGPSGAAVSYSATASDLVDGDVTPTCVPASGSTFALGTQSVDCSVTDNAGNSANGSFNVTVQDTTAPMVIAPANVTAEATGPSGASVSYSGASASDLVDGSITPSCAPPSGSTFALGTTTVTCSATDNAGNTGSADFTVTVQDTTAPDLTIPADQLVEATGPSGAAASWVITATDIVDGAITPVCDATSGSTFPLGTTTVNCSATDDAGNTSNGSFKIVVQDTTAPSVIAPANVTAEATGPSGASVSYSGASASDLVDGSITPSCAPPSGSTFALGTTTVTCSVTDNAGNTGSADFTVTVQDTTGPVLSLPGNLTVAGTSSSGAQVSYTASATDLVDGPVGIVCTPPSGSTFAFGTTTVNCSASDGSGNVSNGSFTISVTYQLSGFYQPVDMDTTLTPHVWNTVKAGSTVPLKWEVFAGSYEFTSTSIVSTLAKQVTCNGGAEDTVEVLATGGTSLRYDTTSGQFVFNWQTPKLPGKCYDVTVTLNDGSSLTAHFKLK